MQLYKVVSESSWTGHTKSTGYLVSIYSPSLSKKVPLGMYTVIPVPLPCLRNTADVLFLKIPILPVIHLDSLFNVKTVPTCFREQSKVTGNPNFIICDDSINRIGLSHLTKSKRHIKMALLLTECQELTTNSAVMQVQAFHENLLVNPKTGSAHVRAVVW